MFGWLKFVGLAGNFAPLPPLLCSAVHGVTEGERGVERAGQKDREKAGGRRRTKTARGPGDEGEIERVREIVAVAVTLHRGILIRVGGRV